MPPPTPTLTFTSHPSLTPYTSPLSTFLPSSFFSSCHPTIRHLAVGAIPFIPPPTTSSPSSSPHSNKNRGPKILLIRRAATDSLPLLWEIPGGAVDDGDASVLHGAARELFEESGLRAKTFGPTVGEGYAFFTRNRVQVWKVSFLVEVLYHPEDDGEESGSGTGGNKDGAGESNGEGNVKVTLDPEEHCDYVWATEEEVKAKRVVVSVNGGGNANANGIGETREVELKFTFPEQENVILKAFDVWRSWKGDEEQE